MISTWFGRALLNFSTRGIFSLFAMLGFKVKVYESWYVKYLGTSGRKPEANK